MKSFKEYLKEEWHTSIPTHRQNIDVFKNPSTRELHELSDNKDKAVRGFIHKSGDLYAWNASKQIHDAMRHDLNFDRDDVESVYLYPKHKHMQLPLSDNWSNHLKEKHPYFKSDHFKTTLKNYTLGRNPPLTEEFDRTINSKRQFRGNLKIDLFKNPSGREIKEITHPKDGFRFIIHHDNMYAWHPDQGTHADVAEELKIFNPHFEGYAYPNKKRMSFYPPYPTPKVSDLEVRMQNHPYFKGPHYHIHFMKYKKDEEID